MEQADSGSLSPTLDYTTERKPAEELFKILSDNLPTGVFIIQDGKFVFVNPQFQKDIGFNEDEIIGTTSLNYIHPADRDKVREEIINRLKGELGPPYEFRIITKSGETRVALETMTSIQYKKKRAALGSHIDITERKKMEEALRESEGRYRALVSLGAEVGETIIMLQDTEQAEGVQTFISEQWLHITGYSKEELIGMSFFDLVHPKDREASVERHQRKMRGEEIPALFEVTVIRKGGTEVPIELTSAYTTYKGKHANVIYIRDITERKRMEEELEKAYQELKETTAQLVQNEKMTALGELTSGIAHELNQPLNNVKIICQSLLRDIDKDRLDAAILPHDLSDMVEQVNKMAGIIDHMRVFTRRIEGKTREEISVNDSVNNLFVLLGEQLRVHDIEVIKDLDPDLPKISANAVSLEQVFVNIMNNARSAVENFRETGKRIEIKSYLNNEKYVAVSIKDNGRGMPPNVRERIFEPFFTTKPPGQGTGLGLSIAKKIIEEHGGRIEVEVAEGEGSTFTIILPVIEAETGGE